MKAVNPRMGIHVREGEHIGEVSPKQVRGESVLRSRRSGKEVGEGGRGGLRRGQRAYDFT